VGVVPAAAQLAVPAILSLLVVLMAVPHAEREHTRLVAPLVVPHAEPAHTVGVVLEAVPHAEPEHTVGVVPAAAQLAVLAILSLLVVLMDVQLCRQGIMQTVDLQRQSTIHVPEIRLHRTVALSHVRRVRHKCGRMLLLLPAIAIPHLSRLCNPR
jgi:hypothetical protein